MAPTRREKEKEEEETIWGLWDTDEEDEKEEAFDEELYAKKWFPGLAVQLGHGGLIVVLFETPSGFAIFCYDGVKLLRPNAIENIWRDFIQDCYTPDSVIWLKDYETFEDKTSAINHETGVNKQLSTLLLKWVLPQQKLAVGRLEYKEIIEEKLEISCLWDEAVMELMWGLKNLLPILLPQEKSELTKEDRLQMSKGMKIVLDRHGFDVKPEMVDDHIIDMTCCV